MKTILTSLCFVFFSCASKDFKKKDLLKINKEHHFSIDNNSTDVNGRTFLGLFELNQIANEVTIGFIDSLNLKITYVDPNLEGVQQKIFKGKFKNKYFEVYLEKKRIVFPPIYWVVQIERLRLALKTDATIVAERYYDHSGMILFFGAGSSFRSYYKYPIISDSE